ncbi:hypothetical protein JB92DRAFT_3109427 [Gautieria morchelliformis]|nr:hypothetical protein JB92DRAFT_3109427 [Gautieria morchelliformis]
MDRLALELIDDIIGHVDDDDVSGSDLLACSQVCRFWLPSSQRRLFHHIEFRSFIIHEIHAQLQRLAHVLLNSPHLASYIRVLDLPDMSCYLLAACCEARGLPFPGRIAIDKPLSSLLHKVTQVQKLKIWNMPWDILPGKLRQSLCRVLELPSIVFVYIHRGQFISNDTFTNFINHARGPIGLSLTFVDTSWVPPPPFKLDKFERSRICHLTRLDMRFWDNSRFSNWLLRSFKLETKQAEDNIDKVERHRICRLTSLDMRCWDISRFVNWLLEPQFHVDASHLHTLHIHLPDIIEDDGVNGLLCAIGSSLRHLSIFLSYYESPFFNLAFNVNLEMLSLVHLKVRRQCLSTISRVLSTNGACAPYPTDPQCGAHGPYPAALSTVQVHRMPLPLSTAAAPPNGAGAPYPADPPYGASVPYVAAHPHGARAPYPAASDGHGLAQAAGPSQAKAVGASGSMARLRFFQAKAEPGSRGLASA